MPRIKWLGESTRRGGQRENGSRGGGVRSHGALYQIVEGFEGHCKDLAFI